MTKTLADEIRRLSAGRRDAALGGAIRGRHPRKRPVDGPVGQPAKRNLILRPIFPQPSATGIEAAAGDSMKIAFEALQRMYCQRRHV